MILFQHMKNSKTYKLLGLLLGVISIALIAYIVWNINGVIDKQSNSTVNIQLGYESLQFDLPSGWHVNTNPNWVSNTSDTLTIISEEAVTRVPSFTRFPVRIITKTKSEILGEGSFEDYFESNYPRQGFQDAELTQLSDSTYRIDGVRIDVDNSSTKNEGVDLFIVGEFNVFWVLLDTELFNDVSQSEFIESLEYNFDDSF